MKLRPTVFSPTLLRRHNPRAFTMLEAVAVIVVLGILAGVGAFAYTQVRKSQADLAGKPVLTVAQAEARRVAAGNGYVFPDKTLMIEALSQREPSVQADSQTSKITFTDGTSYAPETEKNPVNQYRVSTANNSSTVAFAVQTTVEGDMGHCWAMVDVTDAAGTDATTWGFSKTVPLDLCRAEILLECPTFVNGSADNPSNLGDMEGINCVAPPTPIPAPRCVVGELLHPGTKFEVRWGQATGSGAANVTHYKVVLLRDHSAENPNDIVESWVVDATTNTVTLAAGTAGDGELEVPGGFDANTRYSVVVHSVNETGDSTSTEQVVATQTVLPSFYGQPTVGTVTVTASTEGDIPAMTVTWPAATGPVAHYRVERSEGSNSGPWTQVEAAVYPTGDDTMSIVDNSEIGWGASYHYRVTAVADPAWTTQNICGETLRHRSEGSAVTYSGASVEMGEPNLRADVYELGGTIGVNDIVADWAEVSGAQSYELFRWAGAAPGTPNASSRVATRTVGSPTGMHDHTDMDMAPGTYWYQLRANGHGQTKYSAAVRVVVRSQAGLNVQAWATARGTNTIEWDAFPGNTYQVTGVNESGSQVYSTSVGSGSGSPRIRVNHTGVAADTVTTYTVRTASSGLEETDEAVQYPSKPAVTAMGSDRAGGSQDGVIDSLGSNLVTVSNHQPRSTYTVKAATATYSTSGVRSSLQNVTQLGEFILSYTHNGVGRDTQTWYVVTATNRDYNGAGNPITLTTDSDEVVAYQAPHPVTAYANGSETTVTLGTKTTPVYDVNLGWESINRNKASDYCHQRTGHTSAACRYTFDQARVRWPNGVNGSPSVGPRPTVKMVNHVPGSKTGSTTMNNLEQGETQRFSIGACNAGGCAYDDVNLAPGDKSAVQVHTRPGAMNIARSGMGDLVSHQRRYYEGALDGSTSYGVGNATVKELNVGWSKANGHQVTYRWKRERWNNSSINTDKTPAAYNIGWKNTGSDRVTDPRNTFAGGAFDYTIEATAGNGAVRSQSFRVRQAPTPPMAFQSMKYARSGKESNGDGWKFAYRVHPRGFFNHHDGNDNQRRTIGTYPIVSWWVGPAGNREEDSKVLAIKKLGSTYDPQPPADKNQPDWEKNTQYWRSNINMQKDSAWKAPAKMTNTALVGGSGAGKTMPLGKESPMVGILKVDMLHMDSAWRTIDHMVNSGVTPKSTWMGEPSHFGNNAVDTSSDQGVGNWYPLKRKKSTNLPPNADRVAIKNSKYDRPFTHGNHDWERDYD